MPTEIPRAIPASYRRVIMASVLILSPLTRSLRPNVLPCDFVPFSSAAWLILKVQQQMVSATERTCFSGSIANCLCSSSMLSTSTLPHDRWQINILFGWKNETTLYKPVQVFNQQIPISYDQNYTLTIAINRTFSPLQLTGHSTHCSQDDRLTIAINMTSSTLQST